MLLRAGADGQVVAVLYGPVGASCTLSMHDVLMGMAQQQEGSSLPVLYALRPVLLPNCQVLLGTGWPSADAWCVSRFQGGVCMRVLVCVKSRLLALVRPQMSRPGGALHVFLHPLWGCVRVPCVIASLVGLCGRSSSRAPIALHPVCGHKHSLVVLPIVFLPTLITSLSWERHQERR